MRQIKELFFKYTRSNLLWCIVIAHAKVYTHLLQFLSKLSFPGIRTPQIRSHPTSSWVTYYNGKAAPHNSAIYKKLYEPYPSPIASNELPKNLRTYAQETCYEQFVCKIPKGKILGKDTSLTPDNKILWDSNAYLGQSIYGNNHIYRFNTGPSQYHPGTIAMVAGNDTDRNYNHRMTFALPKIHLFQKSGFPIDFYATNTSKPFHNESLTAAGINTEQIIPLSASTHIEAEYICVASTTTICGNMPRRAVDYVKGLFLPSSSLLTPQSKRIFISRITTRKVANEKEVESVLKNYGFETVVLDNLSIADQAQLFSEAEVIIGAHGAGLTNLLFCTPGTKVIELFQPKTIFGHYYCLSQSCNLVYNYLIGKEMHAKHILPMDRDIWIDIPTFEKMLSGLLPR